MVPRGLLCFMHIQPGSATEAILPRVPLRFLIPQPSRCRCLAHLMQVGQPVVRVAQSKLQLGVVLDTKASSLLVAVVVPSRIGPRHHCQQVPSQVGFLGPSYCTSYANLLRPMVALFRTSDCKSNLNWTPISSLGACSFSQELCLMGLA